MLCHYPTRLGNPLLFFSWIPCRASLARNDRGESFFILTDYSENLRSMALRGRGYFFRIADNDRRDNPAAIRNSKQSFCLGITDL
jgi:hypothetical protein